jgi:urea transport system substrate-binding protein
MNKLFATTTSKAIAAVVALCVVVGLASLWWMNASAESTIRVGVLHSRTGTMAESEEPVLLTVLLAIDEINAAGGIMGRRLEPVIADGASDPDTFAREARRLIEDEGVEVIFGTWTSASRKSVIPVVQELDSLLIYPVQYEGLESSESVIYLGSSPNQQIFPALAFARENFGDRAFIVGSEYVYPRMAAVIATDAIRLNGGEVVGEAFLPLGSDDFDGVAKAIAETQPDYILNFVNGDSNKYLFASLAANSVGPKQVPLISFSIGESELAGLDLTEAEGSYASWSYFGSLDNEQNRRFKAALHNRFGEELPVSDPMATAYTGVHLWAEAVRALGGTEPDAVASKLGGKSADGPGGPIYIDPNNNHAWQKAYIGRVLPDGQFEVVWDSGRLVRPQPFPWVRTVNEWDEMLTNLYRSYGNRWDPLPANSEGYTP